MSYSSCVGNPYFGDVPSFGPNPVGTIIDIPRPTQIANTFQPGPAGQTQLLTALIPSGNYILPAGTWIYTGVTQVSATTPATDVIEDTQYRVFYDGVIIAIGDNGYNSGGVGLSLSASPQISAVIVSDGVSILNVSLECDTGTAGTWVFSDGINTSMSQQLVRIA
jgi:hypothetical protein